jgi:hypothetical protein
MKLNPKEEALVELLLDRTAKGNSYVKQSWSSFYHLIKFLDNEQIEEFGKAFEEFFKVRLESLMSFAIILNERRDAFNSSLKKDERGKIAVLDISDDKVGVIKPIVIKAVQRMAGKKFMQLYKAVEECSDRTANIFKFDFIHEAINDPVGGKKLRAKMMEVKLGRK